MITNPGEAGRVVGESLLGTTDSIEDAMEANGIDPALRDDSTFLAVIDSIAMECVGCNWWFDSGELNGDCECPDCSPEPDEEE